MTVDELREMLAEHPGHWRVSVQVPGGISDSPGPVPVADVYAWQDSGAWTADASPVVVVSSA